ncbi:MAG: oligosaccharide flippase family protein [Chloroflexota bacterium]
MSILSRVLQQARRPLYRNAIVLMGNSGLGAGLGFLFWAITARLYPPSEVGLASAAISSALFVATVSLLGLPYALVRFAPTAAGGLATVTTTVVVAVTLVSGVVGSVFVAGVHTWAPNIQDLAPLPELAAAMVTLSAATGASTVLVYASVGARDTRPALAAGAVHGIVKSALVLLFAFVLLRVGFSVLLAWMVGTLAAVAAQVFLLRSQLAPRFDLQLLRFGTFLRYSAGNWAADLAWTAPGLLFPLLVVSILGAEENAYFFIAWAVASLLAGIPTAVSSSLLAEGSHDQAETAAHLRRSLRFTLPIVAAASAVCLVGSSVVLGVFGAPYADAGVLTLRLLSLAALPLSLNMLYLTVARVELDVRRILLIAAGTGGGALVLAMILIGGLGAPGVALGYLIAHATVAAILSVDGLLRSRTKRERAPRQRSVAG